MRFVWLLLSVVFAIGPLQAASLQEPDTGKRWVAAQEDGDCEIRIVDPEGSREFVMRTLLNGDFRLNGQIFSELGSDNIAKEGLEIEAGGQSVLLVPVTDEQLARQVKTDQQHPVLAALEIIADNVELRLHSGKQVAEMAALGFYEARQSFEECFSDLEVRAASSSNGSPAQLVSFSGIQQLAATAGRLGMLSQRLPFTLTIGEDGKPTECKLGVKFRRKYTETSLCKPLLEHHIFEPARDKEGNAIAGEYSSVIDFQMWLNQDGNIDRRYVD